MFGSGGQRGGGGLNFDAGAFGGNDFMGGGGTPPPDFSPDTAIPGGAATPVGPAGKEGKKKVARGGGGGKLGMVIAAAIALIIGIAAGPFIPGLSGVLPSPMKSELEQAKTDLEAKDRQIQSLIKSKDPQGDEPLSQDQLNAMIKERETLSVELSALRTQHEAAMGQLAEAEGKVTLVTQDLARLTDEFVTVQTQYDDLLNETSIISARQEGLLAEVDRLQGQVGQLEDANARQIATKSALASAIDRLTILVREGSPLTPEKYSREARVAEVEALQDKVNQANWVTPELLNEFTALYNKELEIASDREYFFAKVPVTDRYGTTTQQWAEAVMNGNWSVYFRTLDGRFIGSYENVGRGGATRYVFRQDLPPAVQKQIEQEIIASRVPGYEEQLRILAEKQIVTEPGTPFQRTFDSL